jgi:UDP-N-acetyl-D-glucosamine dehydrogenase
MAKLLENTYRQVNIALMNEMAIFCHELGVDLWESISAASTKPFGFQPFYPGPGVGGHCIPIDPNYLSFRVRGLGYPFRFVELAQEINARMPSFVVDRIIRLLNDRDRTVRGARILLLGATYKADVADARESPSNAIAEQLLALGADLRYHDPYVPEWAVGAHLLKCAPDLDQQVEEADIVVLVQAHAEYDLGRLADRSRLLFDTRGRASGPNVVRL